MLQNQTIPAAKERRPETTKEDLLEAIFEKALSIVDFILSFETIRKVEPYIYLVRTKKLVRQSD